MAGLAPLPAVVEMHLFWCWAPLPLQSVPAHSLNPQSYPSLVDHPPQPLGRSWASKELLVW